MSQRTNYRNGDEITLHCGCDGCSPSMINGVLCHEHGCPDSWRDTEEECVVCGCGFYAADRFQSHCQDCLEEYDGPPDGDAWSGGFADNH